MPQMGGSEEDEFVELDENGRPKARRGRKKGAAPRKAEGEAAAPAAEAPAEGGDARPAARRGAPAAGARKKAPVRKKAGGGRKPEGGAAE